MSPILGIFSSAVVPTVGAYESIASAAGTGSSGIITFSSIPSGYQHLQIRYIAKATGTSAGVYHLYTTFNSDGTSNYASHSLSGSGATVAAAGGANLTSIDRPQSVIPNSATALANMHGVGIIDIHDYLSTSKNKTVRILSGSELNRTTSPTGFVVLSSGLWFKTPEAITSISLSVSTGNWATTSSFALYGIKS